MIAADRYLNAAERSAYPAYRKGVEDRAARNKIASEFRSLIYDNNDYWTQLGESAKCLNLYYLSGCWDAFSLGEKKMYARTGEGDFILPMMREALAGIIAEGTHHQERAEKLFEELNSDLAMSGIIELKSNRGDRFSIKQLERSKKAVLAKIEKLNDQSRKDDLVTFEELGVDRLFIDEAHYYKNLAAFTKMRNVGGISQTEAMAVVLLEPGKVARKAEIDGSLKGMQRVVGGDIEEFCPFEEEVAFICNESGKIDGLPLNRAIREEDAIHEFSYGEMTELFANAEQSKKHISGYIVISQDSFPEHYPESARTYAVSSDNKAFQPNMKGQDVRTELAKIRDVANTISADMRQYLDAQNRCQKNRDDKAR